MNYFNPKTSAERYAKGRPDFHINTIRKIKAYLELDQKLDNVLDIACGTGLSTIPLFELAKKVYGTDSSQEMLNIATLHNSVFYALASADKQPFADNTFDLITVSSGVHWFDNDTFLQEAKRLLKPQSWLVLYDN
jgi:ubiquinone/menaquinone biosynthesis C-methylase UbiE